MTIAENIPDAISFAHSLGDICLLGAIVGCVFTLVACACVLSFPVERGEQPATAPSVTILKPLHDAEPGLPARLAAFCGRITALRFRFYAAHRIRPRLPPRWCGRW